MAVPIFTVHPPGETKEYPNSSRTTTDRTTSSHPSHNIINTYFISRLNQAERSLLTKVSTGRSKISMAHFQPRYLTTLTLVFPPLKRIAVSAAKIYGKTPQRGPTTRCHHCPGVFLTDFHLSFSPLVSPLFSACPTLLT
jgi:hypothetical protein